MTTSLPADNSGPIANLHPIQEFICSLCGYKFSQQKYLTNHFNLCKDIENPSDGLGDDAVAAKQECYNEDNCSQELLESDVEIKPVFDVKNEDIVFTEYAVSTAISTRATPKELFDCSNCDHTAVQSTQLEEHMKVHKGNKLFNCYLCDYTSTQKFELAIHLRIHSGEKPFRCTKCNYASARHTDLKQHIRRRTGEKPFKCTICEFACEKSCGLIVHMRKHTGEKQFNCTVCDYASAQLTDLKQHIRTHTGEEPFNSTDLTVHMRTRINKILHPL